MGGVTCCKADSVKLYLAALECVETPYRNFFSQPLRERALFSFIDYQRAGTLPEYVTSDFLLDSGAFSFFGGVEVDIDEYVCKYRNYIVANNVQRFFELDIDVKVGLDKVEKIRHVLESAAGRQSIPVWHPSRGSAYFERMVSEYSYIAISASGKYASRWTRTSEGFSLLRKMVDFARNKGTDVHGLGYTNLALLHLVSFTSIDSTSWQCSRFGQLVSWSAPYLKTYSKKGFRLNDATGMHVHNLCEWQKILRYLERGL